MRFSKIGSGLFSRAAAWAAVFAIAQLGGASRAPALEVVDSTGKRVQLPAKPKRIVTLAPSLGELAADLAGLEIERIVGVSEYTDYPPGLGKIASIGPYHRFNIEKVMVLEPDLVLATSDGNAKDQISHLRELGLPVVVVSTRTLKEVEDSITLVGRAMGAMAEARSMVERLGIGVARVRERAKSRPKRKVALQIGDSPLVVVGRSSFLNEALETVGAVNVFGDMSAHYPRPSVEDAVRRDPDVIIVLALGKDLAEFQRMARRWERFPALKAIKNGEIKVLQGDPVLRPTLRLLEGLVMLEKAIHGEK